MLAHASPWLLMRHHNDSDELRTKTDGPLPGMLLNAQHTFLKTLSGVLPHQVGKPTPQARVAGSGQKVLSLHLRKHA